MAVSRRLIAGDSVYALGVKLGEGTTSDVYLGERLGALPARVTVKVARDDAGAKLLLAEGRHLAALQAIDLPGASYVGQRLPQPVFVGTAGDADMARRVVLILRHPVGYWGSLASVAPMQGSGIDARHIVWIWRRVLEVLGFVHRAAWCHGDLSLGHLLVHPAEHGIRIIGWAEARHVSGADARRACVRDLQQLAWSMRSLLHGHTTSAPAIGPSTPAPLAALLRSASEDAGWLAAHDADATERALSKAAADAFGTPRFVPFDPLAPYATAA